MAETPDPTSGSAPDPTPGRIPGPASGEPSAKPPAQDTPAQETPTMDTPPGEPSAGDAFGGPSPDRVVSDAVTDVAGRATLPLQAARADRNFGTAFWYNDLIEVDDDRETIRQYLVTTEPHTRYEIGQFTLREGLISPELPADELVLPGFSRKWFRIEELGVAVMPTVDLHLHGERKGWTWSVQEVTDGLAARPEDIEALGPEPLPAYLLGHEVTEPDSRHPGRPQTLLAGTVTRDAEGVVRWDGPLPEGCAGAPVFAGLPHEQGLKLVCLGLVRPGEPATLVTFDMLRPAIHHLSPGRRRHWWQRG
ncbi:hypothetical protein [Streptomyces sp. HPF1205]|uniref:hypothetical protein n=1 Tax=Streptomyces sp. HPF1205 TaxID=2873262 RepID=UPI001CECE1B1|nr:hypothetical protein [Streptomyces sp. HPF1205]